MILTSSRPAFITHLKQSCDRLYFVDNLLSTASPSVTQPWIQMLIVCARTVAVVEGRGSHTTCESLGQRQRIEAKDPNTFVMQHKPSTHDGSKDMFIMQHTPSTHDDDDGGERPHCDRRAALRRHAPQHRQPARGRQAQRHPVQRDSGRVQHRVGRCCHRRGGGGEAEELEGAAGGPDHPVRVTVPKPGRERDTGLLRDPGHKRGTRRLAGGSSSSWCPELEVWTTHQGPVEVEQQQGRAADRRGRHVREGVCVEAWRRRGRVDGGGEDDGLADELPEEERRPEGSVGPGQVRRLEHVLEEICAHGRDRVRQDLCT